MNTPSKEQTALPTTAGAAFRAMYSHPSPVILSVLAVFFVGLRIWMGNWQWQDIIAPLIIFLAWPFWEWAIHVFLLHFKPTTVFGKTFDLPLPQKHRQHHREPWDLSNIFIHLGVFPVVVPIIVALFYALMPNAALATGALAMFFLLALNYELTHFLAHINWCPPLSYYQRRVRLHRLHHFRNENLWWGVSMGMGDVILGTAPPVSDAERSPTVDNLHGLSR